MWNLNLFVKVVKTCAIVLAIRVLLWWAIIFWRWSVWLWIYGSFVHVSPSEVLWHKTGHEGVTLMCHSWVEIWDMLGLYHDYVSLWLLIWAIVGKTRLVLLVPVCFDAVHFFLACVEEPWSTLWGQTSLHMLLVENFHLFLSISCVALEDRDRARPCLL